MKKAKITSILLAFLLSFAFLFSFTQPVMAANVKTNVVTQIKTNVSWGTSEHTSTNKYTYNSKGLLTSRKNYFDGTLQSKVSYKYNSYNLVKSAVIYEYDAKMGSVSYTYNDKKQLTKRVTKDGAGKTLITTTFSYNSAGTLKSSKATFKTNFYQKKGTVITQKYTFKNGVLAKAVLTNSSDEIMNNTLSYRYDQYGFLRKYTYKSGYGSGYITRKNTYDNGLLVRYQDTDHSSDGTTYKDDARKITMKTLSLKKSLSAIVQKQQQEIINDGYGTDLYLGTGYM